MPVLQLAAATHMRPGPQAAVAAAAAAVETDVAASDAVAAVAVLTAVAVVVGHCFAGEEGVVQSSQGQGMVGAAKGAVLQALGEQRRLRRQRRWCHRLWTQSLLC